MSFARARAVRGLQTALRSNTARVSAPSRTQLAVGRRYASGHGHAEPSSDLPWLIGGVAVTIPACWYLWPSAHADAGHHGGHDEHDESAHAESAEADEEQSSDLKEAAADANAPKDEDQQSQQQGEEKDAAEAGTDKTPKQQSQEGKAPGEPSASGKASGSQGEGQDAGSVTPTEEAKPKEGGAGAEDHKGKISSDSPASENKSRKVEPDNKGGSKIRVDSGLQKDLGASKEQFDEGSNTEKAATSKPPRKGSEGEITGKQFGLSNSPTRHSHQIDEDPEKSKKGEGGPETAKVMGTVSPDRPQV